jgi:hypothetical protein
MLDDVASTIQPCLAALEQPTADAPPPQVAHLDLAVARAPQVLQLGRHITLCVC